jgi:large subunit ribosomal protein L18
MLGEQKKKNRNRLRRVLSNRKKLRGTAQKPRLCVVKTNKHIFVQLIDDDSGKTLAATSTMCKEVKSHKIGKNKESARKLGEIIGAKAKEQEIKTLVFDRGHSKYHGVLKELADAARQHVKF